MLTILSSTQLLLSSIDPASLFLLLICLSSLSCIISHQFSPLALVTFPFKSKICWPISAWCNGEILEFATTMQIC